MYRQNAVIADVEKGSRVFTSRVAAWDKDGETIAFTAGLRPAAHSGSPIGVEREGQSRSGPPRRATD